MAALMRELENDKNNRGDESTSTNIYQQCINNISVTSEYNISPYNNLSISQSSIDAEI